MKRARDVRDQLAGLMERVEIEPTSNPGDSVGIRKVSVFAKIATVKKLQFLTFHATQIRTLLRP